MQIFAGKKFENPIEIIQAFDDESFKEAFSRIEILRKHPNHCLLGYIRYEAKDIFLNKKIKSKCPLLYFEVFEDKYDFEDYSSTINTIQADINIIPEINYKTYSKAIDKIKKEIALGNTYEVNYTYDYKVKTNLEGLELYKQILPRQKTPYNAYIKNEYEEILSFSPELFFTLKDNKIKTKPMKGTVKRGKTEQEDKENIEFLKSDIKNRAENVMIVDLLRNDLGRIAKTGTVKVDKLFEIETHPTLHQMTSEISAELPGNTTLYEIFNAIYPCGSITGAPKISTMEVISMTEKGSRGVYCGAIGLITPEETIFSVPIRILRKTNKDKFFRCRVGGAIVWDSTAKEEWDETLTKIKFLKQNKEFKLIETILVKGGELQHAKEHSRRMKDSAKKFNFKFSKWTTKKDKGDYILRLLLSKEGLLEEQIIPLDSIKTNKVTVSSNIIDSNNQLLYHKTTCRPWYEKSMGKIKQGLIFDEIFLNEKGEITEGARSNIVLQIGEKLFTPPIKCGLLNGVLRQKMIKEKKLQEKTLLLEDLKKAEKIFCINSVRGMVEVQYDIN